MKILVASVVLSFLIPSSVQAVRVQNPALTENGSKPNIILILTDDLDMSTIPYMPRLKALLTDRGTTFANFFVSDSLCCPSRSSILRGQYAHNHGVLSNTPPDGGFERARALEIEKSTIATWLQGAGYRTVLLGKYLNGYPANEPTYVPPGWDEWYGALGNKPYSNFNYQLNENGQLVSYGGKREDYLTDVIGGKAIDFIKRTSSTGKPFFVYLATFAPHQPAVPAPRHLNEFADVKAPRPPSFNEEDVSDKPSRIRNLPPLNANAIANIDNLYRKRLQSMLAVDEMITNLVATLEATGTLKNTYIFFTSDNGFHLGEHRLRPGKTMPYDEDLRVPLIVRGPGVAAGRVVEHMGVNIDFAPTFAELGGVTSVPSFVDGRSLMPVLGANPPPLNSWRQAFVAEYWEARRGRSELQYQAIRTRDTLYVEWTNGEKELYDLGNDPYELQSLHAAASPDVLGKLSSWLNALRACAAATCRAAEDAPSTITPIQTSSQTTQQAISITGLANADIGLVSAAGAIVALAIIATAVYVLKRRKAS